MCVCVCVCVCVVLVVVVGERERRRREREMKDLIWFDSQTRAWTSRGKQAAESKSVARYVDWLFLQVSGPFCHAGSVRGPAGA